MWWKVATEFMVSQGVAGSFDCVRLCLTSLRMTVGKIGSNSSFQLFLKQVVESLAGVGGLGSHRGGGFFFGGDQDGVEGAGILYVFACDALRDGLHAFKTLGGIEVRALLAGVQFKGTLRTILGNFPDGRQHRTALGAARHG